MAPLADLDIEVRRKCFPAVADSPAVEALRDFRLRVGSGEFLCLVGPSGCGKTTLLNLIAGLDEDFEGVVNPPRRPTRIGYVFQTPRLLPWRSVFDKAYPERLSIGMQRRVSIARAFAVEPDLLLLDEPFVSLDEATARAMRALLIEVWRARPTTVIFVTHDLREAIALADRIAVLSPAPARVVAEIPVELPREHRDDEAAIERLRAEIRLHTEQVS
jgi:NitT/TauT family transport system ATP-binding protein